MKLLRQRNRHACPHAPIHITDIEAAINHWRNLGAHRPTGPLALEVQVLPRFMPAWSGKGWMRSMSTACHPQHPVHGWPRYDTTPDTPCIAIRSTRRVTTCKGCGRTFEEVQHRLAGVPVQKRAAPAGASRWRRVALQPLGGMGHRQPAAPHGNQAGKA